jgi:hypothetical protein
MKPWIAVKLFLSNGLKRRRQRIRQGLQLENKESVSLHPAETSILTSRCPAPISIVKNVLLRSSLTSSENAANDAVNLDMTSQLVLIEIIV